MDLNIMGRAMGIDHAAAREQMVDTQIRPNDVTDYDVLARFLSVPREEFVPAPMVPLAYIDDDIALLKEGHEPRHVLNPMSIAKLVQLADPKPNEVALDIGCGTGYSSAILSGLVESVVAVESRLDLQEKAQETLSSLGCDNVAVLCSPLVQGCPAEAPYDLIFIGAAVEQIPEDVLCQLKDGGRLVCIEGQGTAGQGTKYIRTGDSYSRDLMFNAPGHPLPGFERPETFVF
ncbi:MAG: protein-L-isoaspartate O-methyltransferase [Pseudomonadota bacterium]